MSASIEKRLARRQEVAIRHMRGLRKPKFDDIFERRIYIAPKDIVIDNYQRPKPVVIFNPGAMIKEDKVLIFPRLIFDYYKYVSSIGLFEANLRDLMRSSLSIPVHTSIILWPKEIWEFLGCEDPRIFVAGDKIYMLYTGKGYCYKNGQLTRRDVLGFIELTPSISIARKGFFRIVNEAEEFIPRTNKDSAFIKARNREVTLLTRPEIKERHICWKAVADLDDLSIFEKTLEPVFPNEEWEVKVGWSTNVISLSKDEYLVGWHAVLRSNLAYMNGLAIVNSQGTLLAISNYVLGPRGLQEEYGDRPLVIFGDGLLKYNEKILWIGGVSDYCIGVFITDLDTIMERMRWIKG